MSGVTPIRHVLKWSLTAPATTFTMPEDAVVIDVRTQQGIPTLWTLSSADSRRTQRTFIGFGTGHHIAEPDLLYVGSAHDVEGAGLVFHIFERASSGSSMPEADR